jgi:hypothetical protein
LHDTGGLFHDQVLTLTAMDDQHWSAPFANEVDWVEAVCTVREHVIFTSLSPACSLLVLRSVLPRGHTSALPDDAMYVLGRPSEKSETNNLTSRKSRPVQLSSTWSGRLCRRIHKFEYSIPTSCLGLFGLPKTPSWLTIALKLVCEL